VVEGVAESDDALLEKFFEEGTLSDEEIRTGLTRALVAGSIIPVFATAATSNIGAASVMNFLTTFGPSPDCRGVWSGVDNKDQAVERKIDAADPLSLFVFKTLSESHLGELYLMRVASGTLTSGVDLANLRNAEKERSGQVYLINGKTRSEVDKAVAGDLCALVKLKNTRTGDTLSDTKASVVFPTLKFPEAVIRVAIEPKSRGDEEKISGGLSQLNSEDPTFTVEHNRELRQMIISGQGELHLTIIIERLKNKYGVDVNQQEPRIPYRETITAKADSKYRHKKQSGGAGQFAEVWMRIEPQARGEGISFVNSLVGQNVDRVFVPSVEKGVIAASVEGIYAGYPVIDVKADFYDGKMHPVDSKDIAFQIAGKGAFRDAFLNAKPILLEPVYNLEVVVPEDYMGDVMGDISTRRGKVQGMEAVGNKQMVKAQVPLAELYRYSTALRSMTQGRGMHRMSFSHYDPIPHEIQQKLVDEYRKAREEGNK
jgi:elongation factor G